MSRLIYIVCIGNPEEVEDVDYEIHEVFESVENAKKYLERLGFEHRGWSSTYGVDLWIGPSPLFDVPGEHEVGGWIVCRVLGDDSFDFDRML